jgi:hypothetical protein
MRFSLVFLPSLALPACLASASIAANKSFVRHRHEGKPKILSKQLAVRGGVGPLDPRMVADAAMCVYLANGLVSTLSEDTTAKLYCVQTNEINLAYIRRVGISMLSVALLSIVSSRHSLGTSTKVFFATLPWALESLGSVLNSSQAKLGVKPYGISVILALSTFTLYATYFGKYADAAVKLWTWFWIVAGISIFPFPAQGLKLWGHPSSVADHDIIMGSLGSWALALGLQLWGLTNGKSAEQAIGYAMVPPLLNLFRAVLTGQVKKLGIHTSITVAWAVVGIAIVGTLALN